MPYYCPAGILTVGWGSTGNGVVSGQPWTQAQADQRLEEDAMRFCTGVLSLCPGLAKEPDARLSAVVDFAYNLGLSRLAGSTLRKRINAQDWAGAAAELPKWVWGGGKKLPGLIARRAEEAKLLTQ